MAEHLDQYYRDTELCLMTPGGRRLTRRSSSPSGSSVGTAACRGESTGRTTKQEQQHMTSADDLMEIQERAIMCSAKQLPMEAAEKAKHGHQSSNAAGRKQEPSTPTPRSSVIPWSSVPSSDTSSSAQPQLMYDYTAGSNLSINRSLQLFLQRRKKRAAGPGHHPYLLPPPT